MKILHVAPLSEERWVLTLDDDGAPPISEHANRGEAEGAARVYAETFGFPEVQVHGLDGSLDRMLLYDEALEAPRHDGGGAPGESMA
jgi:hypothetical protein